MARVWYGIFVRGSWQYDGTGVPHRRRVAGGCTAAPDQAPPGAAGEKVQVNRRAQGGPAPRF